MSNDSIITTDTIFPATDTLSVPAAGSYIIVLTIFYYLARVSMQLSNHHFIVIISVIIPKIIRILRCEHKRILVILYITVSIGHKQIIHIAALYHIRGLKRAPCRTQRRISV